MVSQSRFWRARTVRTLVALLVSLIFVFEFISYLNPSIQGALGITSSDPERPFSKVVDVVANESTLSNSAFRVVDSLRWHCNGTTSSDPERPFSKVADVVANESTLSNSVFRVEDSLRWHCNGTTDWQRSYETWIKSGASDAEVLCAAHRRAMEPLAPGTPRLAFLFVTVRDLPLEPLWRAFFRGHEGKYSLYVHASNRKGDFPAESLFHKRTVPSAAVDRFRISFVDAVRRLLAFALLDAAAPNAWFTVVCDSSLPVRAFPFVYHYITRSNDSFVEAFASNDWRRRGGFGYQRHGLPDELIRKGEPWITVHRRHAAVIVGDNAIYPRFRDLWEETGIHSEHYLATMFALADQVGIANRSLMFVNWKEMARTGGHPFGFTGRNFAPEMLEFVQQQRVNKHGFYSKSVLPGFENQASCVYNGVPRSPCFLFARKFSHAPRDLDVFRRVLNQTLVADAR